MPLESRRAPRRKHLPPSAYAVRLLDGLALIALHEADAINAHLVAAGERVRIALQARTAGELLRDQVDLLPESRNRLRSDHALRRELWRGLVRDLKRVQRGRRAA